MSIELEMPGDLARFRLPRGVNARLHELLDRQDSGVRLTSAERKEAEGLVSLSEMLSLLRLRAKREAGVREGEQRRRQSGPQSKPKLR
ncbi:MAG: hypothetical protein HYS13_19850 [Planctomycetia bacterium]|nr:hypothetical protein [Planctomycetia bacterium]